MELSYVGTNYARLADPGTGNLVKLNVLQVQKWEEYDRADVQLLLQISGMNMREAFHVMRYKPTQEVWTEDDIYSALEDLHMEQWGKRVRQTLRDFG